MKTQGSITRPPSSIRHRRNATKGFTLIELLVAMTITTIIVGILVSITSLALDTWNRSRSEIRAARQGKAMIDSMARDFESMVVRSGNNFEWLLAESDPDSSGPKGNGSPTSVDLTFFSAATDRYNGKIGDATADLGGDVSTIGYQLIYQDPINPNSSDEEFKTFVLYRKIVNPDKTFEFILGQPSLDGKIGASGEGDIAEKRISSARTSINSLSASTFKLRIAPPRRLLRRQWQSPSVKEAARLISLPSPEAGLLQRPRLLRALRLQNFKAENSPPSKFH